MPCYCGHAREQHDAEGRCTVTFPDTTAWFCHCVKYAEDPREWSQAQLTAVGFCDRHGVMLVGGACSVCQYEAPLQRLAGELAAARAEITSLNVELDRERAKATRLQTVADAARDYRNWIHRLRDSALMIELIRAGMEPLRKALAALDEKAMAATLSPDTAQAPTSSDRNNDYARLRWYFWKLDRRTRRELLIGLELMPETAVEDLPLNVEMLILDQAERQNKLREVWDLVMARLPEDMRCENPYTNANMITMPKSNDPQLGRE